MDVQSIDLFQAHSEGRVALDGGYIVSSNFLDSSSYAKFEVVAYKAVKSLSTSEEGLTFQSDANKLFVLVEPAEYEQRDVEPFARDGQHQVPHRFSELEQITAANMTRIMLSRQPVNVYSFFTVAKPTPLSSSLLFYNQPDVFDSIAAYFERILIARAGVPPFDAAEAARRIVAGLKRFTIWQEVVEKAPAPEAAWKAPPSPPAAPKAPAAIPVQKKPAAAPPKAPARKAAAKKRPARKAAARKAPVKKAAKKPAVKKALARKPARKPAAKKRPARKPAARKAPARKPAVKKAAAKKRAAKKAPARKAAPKKRAARRPAAKKKPARRK